MSQISTGIKKIINKQYDQYIDDECIDLVHIINICDLYKIKNDANNSVSISEINFSSPNFQKMPNKKNKKKDQTHLLKSPEFNKRYRFFIRIIYACLKINIVIFNTDDNILTLKNNYQLIKSLELKKKQLIAEHINTLKLQHKNISEKVDVEYESYYSKYITKIKIIDLIMKHINKLINNNILDKTDNLLTLILPYFYTYTEFIEEYN
jgi:hypothetical protein